MVTQYFEAVNWKGIACYVDYNCADTSNYSLYLLS